VEAGSPAEIAAALRSLLTCDERWREMSIAARQTYERCYKVDRWVEDVRRVLIDSARRG